MTFTEGVGLALKIDKEGERVGREIYMFNYWIYFYKIFPLDIGNFWENDIY